MSKKLFKMDSFIKYFDDKDFDRIYIVMYKFLSQLSCYLRLAISVNMKEDISEYLLRFLDGFAFEWFDILDKDEESFLWKNFKAIFQGKFISTEYI